MGNTFSILDGKEFDYTGRSVSEFAKLPKAIKFNNEIFKFYAQLDENLEFYIGYLVTKTGAKLWHKDKIKSSEDLKKQLNELANFLKTNNII